VVIKTTDSGLTWNYVRNTNDGDRIECIVNPVHQTVYAGSFYGKIYKSTDGGNSWTTRQIISGKNSRILKINFANALTGWIGTERGYFRTNDGGNGWAYISLNYSPFLAHDMFFFENTQNGFVCSDQNIYRTTDGGNSFTNVFNHNTGERITSIKFINVNTGWACGYHRLVIKTTNNGINWNLTSMDRIHVKCHDLVFNADFANDRVGYLVGQRFCGGIWGTSFEKLFRKTTDGGNSWNYVFFNSGLDAIQDIKFVDSIKAFAVGFYGRILRNDYAGLTEINHNSLQSGKDFSLSQNYPNPFNPSSIIKYDLPVKSRVTLTIYNALGKEIAMLVDEVKNPGTYSVEFDGSDLPSGMYFYKLTAGEFTMTKRMIFLK